jgi:hypothetical protein
MSATDGQRSPAGLEAPAGETVTAYQSVALDQTAGDEAVDGAIDGRAMVVRRHGCRRRVHVVFECEVAADEFGEFDAWLVLDLGECPSLDVAESSGHDERPAP